MQTTHITRYPGTAEAVRARPDIRYFRVSSSNGEVEQIRDALFMEAKRRLSGPGPIGDHPH